MKVLVSDLREQPVDLEVDCPPEELDLSDPDYRFPERVRGTVHFHMAGDKVVANGELSTRIESDCVRCLKNVSVEIKAPIDVVYEHNAQLLTPEVEVLGPEEEGLAYYDGEVVRPEAQLREAVMLELPTLPVCSEACRGLCPVCGQDRNLHECSCHITPTKETSWKSQIQKLKLNENE